MIKSSTTLYRKRIISSKKDLLVLQISNLSIQIFEPCDFLVEGKNFHKTDEIVSNNETYFLHGDVTPSNMKAISLSLWMIDTLVCMVEDLSLLKTSLCMWYRENIYSRFSSNFEWSELFRITRKSLLLITVSVDGVTTNCINVILRISVKKE